MIEVVVSDIVQETPNIRRITLATPTGTALPVFEAGAHIDLHLPNGMIRQYSLVNPPGETDTYQLGVLKEKNSRGGSAWIHETLAKADRLHVSEPRNRFPIAKAARRHILFAGGIGITPILSIARHLSAFGADFAVYYSVRNKHEAAFYEDLVPLGNCIRLLADGRDAAQTVLLEALSSPSDDTHLYVCGPMGYIQAIRSLAHLQKWHDSHFHTEAFCASPLPSDAVDRAFTVHLGRSGATIPVSEGETVIRALRAHGFDIPFSCEQGVCGTCLTKVISGVPDHRDQYLTDEERDANDQFMPCCSRSKSPELVLDL